MQTKILLISAACVWSASACAHGQSAQMDPATAEATPETPMLAAEPVADTSGTPDSAPSQPQPATPAEAQPILAATPEQQPGDALNKEQPTQIVKADDTQAAPSGAVDQAHTEGEPLARFVLTRGIADREPVDEGVSFKPGERVYAFLEVANPNGDEFALNLRWAKDEGDLGEATAVTIGSSPRWRTWTWRRAPEQPGSYRCFIEDQNGQQVAEIPFRVES